MTYSGSPNPDPGDIKANEEMLNRQREEKAEQDRIEEERRILEQEVPYWQRERDFEQNPPLDNLEFNLGIESKRLVGSRFFDAVEGGVETGMDWLRQQAQDDPDRYSDDMLRLLGGGLQNTAWAISKLPLINEIAKGEDWLAEQARGMSEHLTPFLDPRFAGWGTRIATGIIADKGIGKAFKGVKYLGANSIDDLSRFAVSQNPMYAQGAGVLPPPKQLNLPIEPFMSNTYQRNVLVKMKEFGMGDGTWTMKAYDANKGLFSKTNKGRNLMEAYLSPDRLKGSFEGYKKFNKKSVEYKWGAFLEKKGYDLSQGIQVHHINPLYDSIHLFDNVKFNSTEYWSLMNTLIKKNARTGAIQKGDEINNLMMTLGQKADEATPHGIAHKFYKDFVPDFFSKSEMKKINTVPGYRTKKAKRWAVLVNKSEEIILEAHKQWSLLNPVIAQNLPFEELVERLSKLDAKGYNKLIAPKYQLPDMNSIIKEIAADKGLKGPIFKLKTKPVDLSKITRGEKTLLDATDVQQQRNADAVLRSLQKKTKPTDQIDLGL
tara:strand:+ start:133 stop:1767 length:1635 start_codon:yes stop_codon:yes gene_type:complete